MDRPEDAAQRFENLMNRVLEGAVVPFLGAGVSYAASCEDGSVAEGKKIADSRVMASTVCRGLEHKKPPCGSADFGRCPERPTNSCPYGGSLARVCEEYLWQHHSTAEAYDRLVQDVLQIGRFDRLRPQPAHWYIALLAREGLITEVVTTNFDTCVSTAYERTFSTQLPESTGEPCILIWRLSHYRYRGPAAGDKKWRYPQLRVYHTNGCAKCLCLAAHGRSRAAEILLTERHLQKWGVRQWARDLLKDRLRSKTIVFSGFGSPEPQVRFTVLDVLEEMSSEDRNDLGGKQVGHPAAASPRSDTFFVHAYEDLTFEQKQMLSALGGGSAGRREAEDAISRTNAFRGSDLPFFLEAGCDPATITDATPRLPADLFWKCVYTAAFWRALRRSLEEGSPFHRYLQGAGYPIHPLMVYIADWLLPSGDSIPRRERIFGRYPELVELTEGHMTRLSSDLWWARYRKWAIKPGTAWYAALRDRDLLIPAYFLLLYVVAGESKPGPTVPPVDWTELKGLISSGHNAGLWFRLTNRAGLGAGYVPVFLAHPDSAFENCEKVKGFPDDQIWGVQVIVGSWGMCREIKIHVSSNRQADKEIGVATIYQVSLADVIRAADMPAFRQDPVKAIADTLRDAVSMMVRARAYAIDGARGGRL